MASCLHCGHADPGGFVFCPRCGTKAVEGAGPADPLLGRVLNGKYRVEAEIGQGAMGRVYLGEHIGLRKKIALKVLHADLRVSDDSLQRFQREGMAAGKFNHPHAIQIFDFDKGEGGVFYLAMEFVEGVTLTLFLRQRGRLPVEMAVRLARQMVSCLAEAHRHGIVHRDLKPDNVMVSEGSRGELRVKVLDFGLSKLVDRRMDSSLVTQPGRLLGTPLYMAPEQVAGDEADAKSDVYAAGLILYEMLAGERPFGEVDTTQLFLSRPTAEAPSLRANHPHLEVPDELEDLLLRTLARQRALRPSAEEMANALYEIPLDGRATSQATAPRRARGPAVPAAPARPGAPSMDGPAAAPAPEGRGKRPLLVAGLAVLVAAGAWGAYRGLSGAGGRPPRVRDVPAAERTAQDERYLGLLDDARLRLHSNDVQGALTAVNQASLLDCRDAEVFLVRGEIYRARGDLDSAVADFETAAAADPGFPEPWLQLGWIRLERGELDDARESFEAAAEVAPDAAEVLAARGVIASAQGAADEAAKLFERALAADPACAEAHLYLGRLRLDRQDVPGAIASLVEAKRGDPFSVRPLRWLAEAYLAADDPEQADAQLEEAIALQPDSAAIRVERGALLLDLGRNGEAVDFLRASTERVPQDPRLWVLRGVALAESDDGTAAIGALERGLEQGSKDPDARCLLAALLLRTGRVADAVVQLEAVLRDVGDYPTANLDLGLAYFQQGDYPRAAERLERVLEFDAENLPALLNLGILYKDYLGDEPRAGEMLQRYADLGGDDPRVERWMRGLSR